MDFSSINQIQSNKVIISTAVSQPKNKEAKTNEKKAETKMPLSYRIATSAPMEAIESFLADNTVDVVDYYKPSLQHGAAFWANKLPGVDNLKAEDMTWSEIGAVYGSAALAPAALVGGGWIAGSYLFGAGLTTTATVGTGALTWKTAATGIPLIMVACGQIPETSDPSRTDSPSSIHAVPVSGLGPNDFSVTGGPKVPFNFSFKLVGNILEDSGTINVYMGTKNINAAAIVHDDLNTCTVNNYADCGPDSCRVVNAGARILEDLDGNQIVSVADNNNLDMLAAIFPGVYYGQRRILAWSGSNTYKNDTALNVDASNEGMMLPLSANFSNANFLTNGLSWAGIMDIAPDMCNFDLTSIQNLVKGRNGSQALDWETITNDFGGSLKTDLPPALPMYLDKITVESLVTGKKRVIDFNNRKDFTDFNSSTGAYSFNLIIDNDDVSEEIVDFGYAELMVSAEGHLDPTGILDQGDAGRYFNYIEATVLEQ